MLNTLQHKTNQVGGTVLVASRQVWLAGLGAAAVTRDWAEKEAATVMRTLIKEGTAVESRAFRLVGDQIETSMTKADTIWKKTRATVETAARAYADTAVALVRQTLPKALPRIELPAMQKPATPKATRARRIVKTRAAKPVKRAKRAVKAASKR